MTTTDTDSSLQTVRIDVYRKDASAVWALLAERNPERQPSNSASPDDAGADSEWTERELTMLYRRCKPVQRAILVALADAATKQKVLTYEELRAAAASAANDSTFNDGQLAANLAWISRYAIKVKGTKQWPVAEDYREEDETWTYRMEKKIGEWLIRISRTVK